MASVGVVDSTISLRFFLKSRMLRSSWAGVIPAPAAIGTRRMTVPSRVLPPFCHLSISATQLLMRCPTPTSEGSIFFCATAMPFFAADSKAGLTATADAKKCSYRVFSKLVTTLMFPGLCVLASSRMASSRHCEMCLAFALSCILMCLLGVEAIFGKFY